MFSPGPAAAVFTVAALASGVVAAQSKIPGAPSNAPPRFTVDYIEKAESLTEKVQVAFDLAYMASDWQRANKVQSTLGDYLNRMGATPGTGRVHIFYVQAYADHYGAATLKDFQYLTNGKSSEDALRESFAVVHAPGTEGRLQESAPGKTLFGTYFTASPSNDGKSFDVRWMSMTGEFYTRVRSEGLALRASREAARIEAQRIAALRAMHVANHAAGEAKAREMLARHLQQGSPRSGVEIEASSPIRGLDALVNIPFTFQPPTQAGPSPAPLFDPFTMPVAHPPVSFDQPPVMPQQPVPLSQPM